MEATRVGTELTGGPGVLAVSHGPTEAGSAVTKANACIIQASVRRRQLRAEFPQKPDSAERLRAKLHRQTAEEAHDVVEQPDLVWTHGPNIPNLVSEVKKETLVAPARLAGGGGEEAVAAVPVRVR